MRLKEGLPWNLNVDLNNWLKIYQELNEPYNNN